MQRFVLFKPKCAGSGEIEALQESLPTLRIIESIAGKGFLVEAAGTTLSEVRRLLPDWTVEEERIHPAPRTMPDLD